MATGISTQYKNRMLDSVYGSGNPATLFCRFWTVAPAIDGTGGTEVSGNGYAPASLTNNATNFPAAAAGAKANATAFTFPTLTGTWGAIVAVTVHDASTGGTMVNEVTFADVGLPSLVPVTGDTPVVNAGDLSVSL